MTVKVESLGPRALEVRVEGKLDETDYEAFVPLANQRIKEHGTIDLLLRVHDFRGWTPGALWEDLKFDVAHYSDISRLALVGEDESKEWMATLSKPFTRADVKFFPETEIESARNWVQQGARP